MCTPLCDGPDRRVESQAPVVGTRPMGADVDSDGQIRTRGLRAVDPITERNPRNEKAPLRVPSQVAGPGFEPGTSGL